MSTTQTSPTQGVVFVKAEKPAAKNVLNLDTLQKESKTVDFSYPVYQTVEALQNVDSTELLRVYNLGAKRQALLAAKQSIEGADTKLFTQQVALFSTMKPFSEISDRKERVSAIVAFWKEKGMIDVFRAMFASATADSDNDEPEDE